MSDFRSEIVSEIQAAFQNKSKLSIQGGSSKAFYARQIEGKTLSLSGHTGIIEYEPSELYITAKSGTPLSVIERTIAEHNQMIPCEPPYFKNTATIGGTIACGLSGPRRAYAGNVRDCVLGTEIINGKGEELRFGGRVMKNVAGYDASRLMCGALGTLGVLMTITIRLLPTPACEQTSILSLDESAAINKMNQWANTPLPISATFYDGQNLYVRLSGSSSSVIEAKKVLGGENFEDHDTFWKSVKEHQHEFFKNDDTLWRISVPPNTQAISLSSQSAMEWNGGLRWYKTDVDETVIREKVAKFGGQANLFKGNNCKEKFHPLPDATMKIHKNLKNVFDPAGILNPGKMFPEL